MTHKRLIANLTASSIVLIALGACSGLVGADGNDGITPTVKSRPASPEECIIGGVVITVNDKTAIVCDGTNGGTGSPASSVTTINLCPGVTSYPSVFIEVALCVDDQLYAVYSIPGAFLTLIPPGVYTSNALGSACNLTVLEHCQVQY